jgi:hypothetical protein
MSVGRTYPLPSQIEHLELSSFLTDTIHLDLAT